MIERITIDADRLLNTFLTILRINSYYPNEDQVVRALQPKLVRTGVELTTDENRNVLGYWPGVESAGPPRANSPLRPYRYRATNRRTKANRAGWRGAFGRLDRAGG